MLQLYSQICIRSIIPHDLESKLMKLISFVGLIKRKIQELITWLGLLRKVSVFMFTSGGSKADFFPNA